MKKIFCSFLFLALILTVFRLPAQNPTSKEFRPINNIVKISPVQLARGTFLISYERMLSQQKYSLVLTGGATSRPLPWIDGTEKGSQQELQFRIYLVAPDNVPVDRKNILFCKGLYLGPYASSQFRRQVSRQYGRNQVSIDTYSGGLVIGAQFALGNRLFLDLFSGGGYRVSNENVDITTFFGRIPGPQSGIVAKGGFQLGIGF